MGRNTKKPNTTKGPINPKQKHYKKIIKEFLLYDLKLIRDLFEGLEHDFINCFEILVTIPNHAFIISSVIWFIFSSKNIKFGTSIFCNLRLVSFHQNWCNLVQNLEKLIQF